MEKSYEFQKPPENEDLLHKIMLEVNGEKVGEANLEYRNHPFPFYYLELIYIDQKKQGQGLGRELFEKVNEFLHQKGKPGLLVNAINRKSLAREMYQRHGWGLIPNHEDWMGYGLEGIDQAQINQAIYLINRREVRDEKTKAA